MFKVASPDYPALIERRVRVPSVLMGVLDPDAPEPTCRELLARLNDGSVPTRDVAVQGSPKVPNARCELCGSATGEGDRPLEFRLWVEPCMDFEDLHLQWRGISDSEKERAKCARWMIGIETEFGDAPLRDFHLQLQLLQAVAPDFTLVFDVASCRPFSGEWAREAAGSRIPPAPEFLYSIHAVYDEQTGEQCWLHTHGLMRCGSIELEILDTRFDDSATLGRLINTVAAMFVDGGVPPQDTVFSAGAGLDLVWLPWQEGLGKLPSAILGARQDRDANHDHPSGILFARSGWIFTKYKSPAVYLASLGDNPVLYLSSMETERMSLLARARIHEFGELFAAAGADTDNWMFVVKLGYPIDDAETENDREHLWFQVHGLTNETIDATLLNQPHGIQRMHEGLRGEHSLELLTDWSIMNRELGSFGPDTIYHLKRQLSANRG